jgi:hypothetical protein
VRPCQSLIVSLVYLKYTHSLDKTRVSKTGFGRLLWTSAIWLIPDLRITEKHTQRMAAMWSKAVVGLVQISTLYIAGLGQLRTVKKIKYKPPNGA